MNMNVITLEDNKEYIILDSINYNNNDYFILVDPTDYENVNVRKVLIENNEQSLVKLDSNTEYENVLILFNEKHNGGSSAE